MTCCNYSNTSGPDEDKQGGYPLIEPECLLLLEESVVVYPLIEFLQSVARQVRCSPPSLLDHMCSTPFTRFSNVSLTFKAGMQFGSADKGANQRLTGDADVFFDRLIVCNPDTYAKLRVEK